MAQLISQVDINKDFFSGNPNAGAITGGPNASIGALITSLLPNALIAAGAIMLFLIVGAGFKMISSAGSDDAKAAAQAKTTLTYSVIGFLLVISAYFILQVVGVITGIDFLKISNP